MSPDSKPWTPETPEGVTELASLLRKNKLFTF